MNNFLSVLTSWKNKSNYNNRNIISKNNKYFDITKYTLSVPQLKGKQILFFTDLHIQDDDFYSEVLIKEINKIGADWVIYGGDLLTILYYYRVGARILSRIKAKKQKFTVLGNWEQRRTYWIPINTWNNYFNSTGFKLLADSSYKTQNIKFTGLLPDSELSSNSKNNKNEINILIAHKPDDAVNFIKKDSSKYLCFCGHTHGGQIRIPYFGALMTASKYWKLLEYGHYINRKTSSDLIISNGLGYSGYKRRIFCNPEIVVIDFK